MAPVRLPTTMPRRSSPVRLVRRACRRCRNYTNNVLSPCPSCGAAFPRVRFAAIPLWLGGIALVAIGLAWLGGLG